MTLVRDVPKATPISYGHTYLTDRPTRIATIAVGYGDGYFLLRQQPRLRPGGRASMPSAGARDDGPDNC